MARHYAPALSYAAFKAKKPSGKYSNYLSFLAKRRPGWDPKRSSVAQTIKAKPQPQQAPNYDDLLAAVGQFETPAQLEARSNRMAQTQQTYQQKLIDQEYAQARAEAQRQQESFQAAGRAAAAMNAELMGRVGGAYSDAAQGVTSLGGALGAAMSGATAADVAAANTQLARVGAPGVVVGGPVGENSIAGGAQAAIENYRGGTLPAAQLGSSGVAQQFGMSNLIGAQNLRATQEAQAGYIKVTGEAARAKANAIKALAAGRPQVAMQFLQQLQTAQRQQIALAQGLLGAKQASATQAAQLAMTKAKFKIDKSQVDPVKSKATGFVTYVDGTQPLDENGKKIPNSRLEAMTPAQKAALELQRAQERRLAMSAQIEWSQVDTNKSLAAGIVVDRRGKPILVNGKTVPVKNLLTGTKSGGRTLTPNKLVDVMSDAQRMAEEFYYGYTKDPKTGKRVAATQGGDFVAGDDSTYGTGRLTYDKALRRLMLQGAPPKAARAILDELYQRGEANRPIFTDAEAKRAKKKLGKANFVSALAQIKKAMEAGNFDTADRMIEEVLSGVGIGFGR